MDCDSTIFATQNEIVRRVDFWKVFLTQFLPTELRKQKKKFAELRQGWMSVMEYSKKFSELGRFAQKVMEDEEVKIDQFQEGLRT